MQLIFSPQKVQKKHRSISDGRRSRVFVNGLTAEATGGMNKRGATEYNGALLIHFP